MKKGSTTEVTIERMAYKAMGVGHLEEESQQGKVIMVPGTLPGERVEVVITKKKKNYLEGRKIRSITSSPLEQKAPCPYFGVCGGCKWQHLSYDKQVEFKQGTIQDSLRKIGKMTDLPEMLPMIPSPEEYFYRNKIELSFGVVPYKSQAQHHEAKQSEDGPAEEEQGTYLGYHGSGSFYKIVDVDACMLMSEFTNKLLEIIKGFVMKKGLTAHDPRSHEGFLRHLVMREGKNTGEVMINLITAPTEEYTEEFFKPLIDELLLQEKDDHKIESILWSINGSKADVARADETKILYGRDYIVDKIGDLLFKISPFSFFQTNTKGAEVLYDVVRQFADLKGGEKVIDLYAGTGTIGMYLAKDASKVFAVEENEGAVEDAKTNARMNNIMNIDFQTGKVEKDAFPLVFERPDLVIIDPPRAGLHPRALEMLPKFRAQKIIYVSCNPTTLARDIEFLSKKYKVGRIQGVDMFPQTYHVETVIELIRK